MKGVCDVCYLVDGDKTEKKIEYCKVCNAYICKECEPNWLRRGRAAIKERLK